jgi:hypothetical protein
MFGVFFYWPYPFCLSQLPANSVSSAGEQTLEYLVSFSSGHTPFIYFRAMRPLLQVQVSIVWNIDIFFFWPYAFCLSQLPVPPAASAGEQSLKYLWYLTVVT